MRTAAVGTASFLKLVVGHCLPNPSQPALPAVLLVALLGGGVGALVVYLDYPFPDSAEAFTSTGEYSLWLFLLCAQTALWALALMTHVCYSRSHPGQRPDTTRHQRCPTTSACPPTRPSNRSIRFDLVAASEIKTRAPTDVDREAISIIECGGKPNIPLFARICRATGIPFVVVHDSDRKTSGRLAPAEQR